jgi:hypothetical protein
LDQPLQRHAHRIGKLGGGEARKQTEPSDNAPKKHTALLCWQLASGGHDGGKLVIAEGEHWRQNHSWTKPRYDLVFAAAVNSNAASRCSNGFYAGPNLPRLPASLLALWDFSHSPNALTDRSDKASRAACHSLACRLENDFAVAPIGHFQRLTKC